jgi:hypothetical protein
MAREPKLYKAYFFRGVDPVIGQIRKIITEKHGAVTNLSAIEKAGGPTYTTVNNWMRGKTRRPQNATIEAAGRALGMKRVWVDGKEKPNGKRTIS